MPVFALYQFDDPSLVLDDAPGNGLQNGIYLNGATADGGQLVLDGENDLAKIYASDTFQMPRGTLDITFTPTGSDLSGPQTVLSRDSTGEHGGSYRIEVLPDGAVRISHESDGATHVSQTPAGFYAPGETINVTYSWDSNPPDGADPTAGGAGGQLLITNATSGASYGDSVPGDLDFDMGSQNQPWILGAGQSHSDPAILNNLDQHFQGSVETFSLSDSVDNGGPSRDGIVYGTDGNDLIDHTYVDPTDGDVIDGNDAIIPGDGPNDDRVVAGRGDDTILAGIGNDTVWAGEGNDVIYGGEGDDVLHGEAGDDLIHGDAGNDTIHGGNGRDTVYGGRGDDVIDTSTPLDGAHLPDIDYPGLYGADPDPENDRDLVYGGAGNDTIRTGDDADTIYGGTGNDYIDSGIDADLVYGGRGNDTIIGSEGADTIEGGGGDDLIYGGFGPVGADILDLPDATDLRPDNNRDLLYGGRGNDTIYGRDDDDTLWGGSGDDLLFGGVDDDELHGQSGNDTLHGDEGNDSLYGGGGDDSLYGGAGDDLLEGGMGNDELHGGAGNDTISAGQGDDFVNGGEGDDRIDGGMGDDTLAGDAGNDTIQGGQGNDIIDGGAGDDLLMGGTGNDTLTGGDGNDTIHGGQGADHIHTGTGNDVVHGGAGNDTIFVGAGVNRIYGGGDRDTIVITTAEAGPGSFIDGNENGDDWDTLDLSGAGPLSIVYDADNAENGVVTFLDADGNPTGTMRFINIENVIPCFTPGTLIATPRGEVPVESLRAGDKVITRDNGIQEIRWAGQKELSAEDLALNPLLQPVLVRAHSLGNGLPERDMMVSPNHRLLIANDRTQLYFDEHEVLVAAKHMVGAPGISLAPAAGVEYIHFMCDRHEVVLSDGAWTESFQPGDYTLRGMGAEQRGEIFALFPELRTPLGLENYHAARRSLKRHEARLLAV